MSILHSMTDEEKFKYRAEKRKAIRDYHAELIKDLGVSEFDFDMKSQFKHNGKTVIGVFPTEFKRPNGFFFELVDSDLNILDPQRTIYRLPPNNHFEEEYEILPKGAYIVPFDEARVVSKESVAIKGLTAVTASDEVFKVTAKAQDVAQEIKKSMEPMVGMKPMIVRDVEEKKDANPDNKDIPNKLAPIIIPTQRDLFIGAAIQGLCSNTNFEIINIPAKAIEIADKTLKLLNK